MITKEIISKSIDEAIWKCKPKFESMHTPKQIAKYFKLDYELIDSSKNNIPVHTLWAPDLTEGNIHKFTDPNNDDCPIYVPDSIFERKTGLLTSDWYENEFPQQLEESEWTSDEISEAVTDSTYPLKQFIKDYNDLPMNIKSSIGNLVFHSYESENSSGQFTELSDNGKGNIILFRNCIEKEGFRGSIMSNPRKTFFHEATHSFASSVALKTPKPYDFVHSAEYLAGTKDYKKARREDKKLNGDKYATVYGRSAKSFVEEQADVGSAMLLKSLSKNDPEYNTYKMELAKGYKRPYNEDDYLSVDDFLKRYPNRVSMLNKYMSLDLD